LGEIFFHNTDLFYKTPIVNFDNHAGNEHFGQINIVEMNASSNAEIIFGILEQLSAAHIDEKIATCLLTGMISQTNSFKTPNVAPSTLNIASRLMNLGADREKIIHNLYRTKSISSLKLWGRALNNLQHDREIGMAWTTITRDDFIRSDASEEDLHGIASELITNSPEAKIILLLHEFNDNKQTGKIRGLLTTGKDQDALEMAAAYSPQGNNKFASFVLEDKTLNEAEKEILEHLRSYLKTR
jgi:phosphoesterase RecJ-like protein